MLIQLVPRLPPLIDGLGDYSLVLARALAEGPGIATRFLVTDPAWQPGPSSPDHRRVGPHTAAGLAAALADAGATTVLLHFVNYAYAPRNGQPAWLVDGLAHWRRTGTGRRLVTMFHELYASSPLPWKRVFWQAPFQWRLSARLARLSDATWTSNDRYGAWLDARTGRPCARWPVISNIGEPASVPAFAERQPALVVFGRAASRRRAYGHFAAGLAGWCARFGVQELHDVGADPGLELPAFPGVAVHRHGPLPAAEVSAVLARARFGFMETVNGILGKSGVFAAYASHGLVPVVERPCPAQDGLALDASFAALAAPPAEAALPGIATAARAWYLGHESRRLAAAAAVIINGDGTGARC